MIFVEVEESDKDSLILAFWMHAMFVECNDYVQLSQILAFLYMSKNLIY